MCWALLVVEDSGSVPCPWPTDDLLLASRKWFVCNAVQITALLSLTSHRPACHIATHDPVEGQIRGMTRGRLYDMTAHRKDILRASKIP